MHGNVWQWVEDPYHAGYDGAPSDGSVWKEGADARLRVIRGGCWSADPQFLRSADRLWDTSVDRGNSLGFRVARTLTP
jgi:formylglycine-generating enzyme required for sulfatase activity